MKINVFDLSSIENAICKLKRYKIELEENLRNHIKQLTKQGYNFMISIVPEDTGGLKSSISWEFDGEKGVIKVGSKYGIFIEYGTGIVGQNAPHPEPKEGWKYDLNAHGIKGWLYFDEKQNRLRWTRGQPASAFVYKTLKFLEKEAGKGILVMMNG